MDDSTKQFQFDTTRKWANWRGHVTYARTILDQWLTLSMSTIPIVERAWLC